MNELMKSTVVMCETLYLVQLSVSRDKLLHIFYVFSTKQYRRRHHVLELPSAAFVRPSVRPDRSDYRSDYHDLMNGFSNLDET